MPPHAAGAVLVTYMAQRFRYQSPDGWTERIASGVVTVNGEVTVPDRVLAEGDRIAYSVVLHEPPVDTGITLLHEEPGFAVAVKPGQLPSHGDGTFVTHTFIYAIGRMLDSGGGKARLVHRLDRETSGIMVVARTKPAHASLMKQFAAGTVGKEYMAVARGRVERDRFEVAGWLGRAAGSIISIRRGMVPAGSFDARESRTEFEVVRRLDDATVVRCVPKTGRTNQIRVHLESVGHPIVGDKMYGKTDEEYLAFVRHVKAGGDVAYAGHAETPRQWLHASRLSFDHPETGARLVFEAAPPADMADWIAARS